jgi:hypothetical protein
VASRLTEDIVSSIEDSVYKTAYAAVNGALLTGNEENVYCQDPQNDAGRSEYPCPCY